jgi:hypothetical protein
MVSLVTFSSLEIFKFVFRLHQLFIVAEVKTKHMPPAELLDVTCCNRRHLIAHSLVRVSESPNNLR